MLGILKARCHDTKHAGRPSSMLEGHQGRWQASKNAGSTASTLVIQQESTLAVLQAHWQASKHAGSPARTLANTPAVGSPASTLSGQHVR